MSSARRADCSASRAARAWRRASTCRSSRRASSTRRASRASPITWASASRTRKCRPRSDSSCRGLKQTAQQRNRDLMQRVNRYLSPIELDYEPDVLTLTPAGNATERHMCLAYARKARDHFGATSDELAEFWSQKLGTDAKKLGLPEGRDLLNTIRAKTMKRGGVGYVQPDSGSFPADGRHEPLHPGGRRHARPHVARRHQRRRAGHRGAAGRGDEHGGRRAQRHPGPQLHAGLAGPEGQESLPRGRGGPAASPRRGRGHRDEQSRPEVRRRFQHGGAGPPAAGLPEERLHRLRPFGAAAARAASATPARGRTSTSARPNERTRSSRRSARL